MVSTMINHNQPSRPFYQWLGQILPFAILAVWLNLIPQAHATTPPGLPVLNAKQDAFSIPISGLRTNANLKTMVANIDVLGTKTETLSYSSPQNIYALSITGNVGLNSNASTIKVVLIDNATQKEYLVYETYPFLNDNSSFDIQEVCEETCILPQIASFSLRIEVTEAFVSIREIAYSDTPIVEDSVVLKANQDATKIQKLNQQQLGWIAGETSVSKLTYEQKKHLFLKPEVPNLQGFEYYRGGVFEIQSNTTGMPSASALVTSFDWRKRHGENWITSVKDQKPQCGSCWAFASTGATEAVTNLYFNRHLDLDLAEQDALSCSGAGSCAGSDSNSIIKVFDFFTDTGIVDEDCFLYSATDEVCSNKCDSPDELIKINGTLDFESSPKTEDSLKRMIIENGPVSGAIASLEHAMTLVGFQTDSTDGKTIWIFKNSWGNDWGAKAGTLDELDESDKKKWGEYWEGGYGKNGYAYIRLDMGNVIATYAIQTPITSLQPRQINCVDNDNDGYCNWGISKDKPATCPASCKLERDCDDSNPTAGPFDANYNCGENVLPTTKQFNVFNDGDAELLISSITPESSAPWISINPTAFNVPAKGTQLVTVQIDYTQAPAGSSATRLLVHSNDPDETPFPNGVNVMVERPNLTTTGTLPILGEPVALSAPDSPVNTTSRFSGGILVNDKSPQQQVILYLSDKVDLQGEIKVDPTHLGQPAIIFVYAEATLPPSPEVYYFMLGEGLNILAWDQNPANLATFMSATLGDTQTVPMYQGTFFYPGTLKVYFGYRLMDGTVVTSGQAIDITILP